MLHIERFTGGPVDTHCYWISAPEGSLLIDAPPGADQYFAHHTIDTLLLTHGHFDHTTDAAAIKRRHTCQVGFHPDTLPLVTDPNIFRRWGFEVDIPLVEGDFFITETKNRVFNGLAFQIFEVPGHCPGSLCFYWPAPLEISQPGILFGGDVLFREGIGRWDLPGGNKELLIQGIRSKLLPLPGNTRVLAGHGPETTLEFEKQHNAWLSEE